MSSPFLVSPPKLPYSIHASGALSLQYKTSNNFGHQVGLKHPTGKYNQHLNNWYDTLTKTRMPFLQQFFTNDSLSNKPCFGLAHLYTAHPQLRSRLICLNSQLEVLFTSVNLSVSSSLSKKFKNSD